MIITPADIKGTDEDSEQKRLLCWCSLNFTQYPELRWLHHSPNGGARSKSEAAKFKVMGTKSGFPDLILLAKRGKFAALLIELKIPKVINHKNGGASDEQVKWGIYLLDSGYGYRLCHGWEMARDTLVSYLEWK